uniref:Uncharacterized protein n=1 Tax=Meloidogyne enterolobii TaxID=390850 RepID=A0A6V7U1Q1_MELEN|nr:unnamed protein product [Meloidogyne enterolobii]
MPNLLSKLIFIFNLIINFLPSIKSLQFELLPQEFYLPFIDVLKIQKGHFLPIIKYQLKNKEEEYLNWLNDQIERENDEEDNKNNFKNFEEFLKISEGILEPRKNFQKFQNNFLTKNEGFLNNFTCEATQKLIEDSKRIFSVACLDENRSPKIIRINSCNENNEECGEIETRSRFELKRGRFHCPSEITCITEILLDKIPTTFEFQLLINIILFCLIVFVTKEISI